jgi:hypothetical protein
MVKTEAIAERQVEWIPDGWDWASRKTGVVRDGGLQGSITLDYYFLNKDIDGAIEFLKQIKRAMAETKK